MHNGKYYTESYKQKQSEKHDRLWGPILEHEKICEKCGKDYIFTGRLKTKIYEQSRFCTRSCANSRQEYWNENATSYKVIAFRHHEKKCVMCGFDKIVAVHHNDHDKKNNAPENLIPLCPNHHEMIHSKWTAEVQPDIDEYVKKYLKNLAS